MKTLNATFRIVTPMFLGDANQDTTSLRPPSVKGALRFWWRALNWSRIRSTQVDEVSALKKLFKEEARLFGSVATDGEGGQGQFLLQLAPGKSSGWEIARSIDLSLSFKPEPGHTYLLGQALWNMGNKKNEVDPHFVHSALLSQTFTLRLIFKPGCTEEDAKSIGDALRLWGMLGGLGARSRKGFGSVAIQSMSGFGELPVATTQNEYHGVLTEILGNLVQDTPPFSAFSQHTLINQSLTGKSAWALLGMLGSKQQFFRSYGRKDPRTGEYRVGGQKAAQKFSADHDTMWKVARGEKIDKEEGHPKRVIFGLPHNYRFKDGGEATVDAKHFERRASPLFVHIHEFRTGEVVAIQTVLEARFLPNCEKLVLNQKIGKSKKECGRTLIQADYSQLRKYLAEFGEGKPLYG